MFHGANRSLSDTISPGCPASWDFMISGSWIFKNVRSNSAKLFGIGGFCFYFYWFAGRRLLETPIEQYLAHPELDLPFCLCWANENWTRRWDGLDLEILIAQYHSENGDFSFIKDVSEYFKDARYIRIEGKPLLLVYRAELLPSPELTAERWRVWCRDNGFARFSACTQSFESVDPKVYGFDAAIEFPPNNSNCPRYPIEVAGLNPDFSGVLLDWDYSDAVAGITRPPTIDCSAAYAPLGTMKHGGPAPAPCLLAATLGRISRMVEECDCGYRQAVPGKIRAVGFVNAWNEWAEGAYLEPDQRYGYAYLQATRDALVDAQRSDVAELRKKLVIVGHDAHPHGAQFLTLNLLRELKNKFRY